MISGEVPNTNLPLPVSSVTMLAISAEVAVPNPTRIPEPSAAPMYVRLLVVSTANSYCVNAAAAGAAVPRLTNIFDAINHSR